MFVEEDELNADPNKYVVMNSNTMTWKNTSCKGFSYKLLEKVVDPRKGRSTALIKLDPGTTLPTETLDERCDILVLEGELNDGHSLHGTHTFIRSQPGDLQTLSSQTGCVLYLKRRKPIRKTDTDRLLIDAKKSNGNLTRHVAPEYFTFTAISMALRLRAWLMSTPTSRFLPMTMQWETKPL